jgi:hypothetical protein
MGHPARSTPIYRLGYSELLIMFDKGKNYNVSHFAFVFIQLLHLLSSQHFFITFNLLIDLCIESNLRETEYELATSE